MTRTRSTARRIGVTLLNLLVPGLGLLRLGEGRRALMWLVAPFVAIALLGLLMAVAPLPGLAAVHAVFALVILAAIVLYLGSMRATWRRSRIVADRPARWTRWYALAGALFGSMIASNLAIPALHRFYKPFYMPSESMAPTLELGDKMIADMRGGRSPAVGDLVLVDAPGGVIYVKRVAALAGSRIAMRDGVPEVNGRPARQRSLGPATYRTRDGPARATRLVERLPGERGTHRVLDTGFFPAADEMAERRVPPGHVFVLGDNRDRSADSRFPAGVGGLAMVPLAALRGRPLLIHWSVDRERIGADVRR